MFGSGFSFKQGSGWLVATVASAVLLATSVLGRFIFKDKVKSNIYRTTTYVALTWLVIFLSAQTIVPISDYVKYMPYYTEFYNKYDLSKDIQTITRSNGKYYKLPKLDTA